MTTALDLITLALKTCGANGVGQAPSAEDTGDCLTALNGMLAQWAQRRWLVWHLVDLVKRSTGAASYTIGPGCDFDTPRVSALEAAFVRLNPGTSMPIDYPLQIVQAREDRNAVPLKSFQSIPMSVFLDSDYPAGTVYFWPVPLSLYEMHLTVKAALAKITDLTADMAMPDEYFEALLWNLTIRLAPMYQLAPRPDVIAQARAALQTIRSVNFEVPTLKLPTALTARGRPGAIGSQLDVVFGLGTTRLG